MGHIVYDSEKKAARRRDVFARDAIDRDAVNLFCDWHQLVLEPATFRREKYVHLLPVAADLPPRDVAKPLHCLDCRECRWLHDTGFRAQFALRKTVALPKDAQESPVAEGHFVLSETDSQGAHQRAGSVLDQMGEPVVGDSFAPMVKDCSRVGVLRSFNQTGT